MHRKAKVSIKMDTTHTKNPQPIESNFTRILYTLCSYLPLKPTSYYNTHSIAHKSLLTLVKDEYIARINFTTINFTAVKKHS